jgi:hypothetical protein
MIRAVGAQKWNVGFVETSFRIQTDFIAVWCSVTNNGLPSTNPFHCQDNTIKVNGICESKCKVFEPVFKFVTINTLVWNCTPMEYAYHPNAFITNLHSLQYSFSLTGCINQLFLLSYLTCAAFLWQKWVPTNQLSIPYMLCVLLVFSSSLTALVKNINYEGWNKKTVTLLLKSYLFVNTMIVCNNETDLKI